MSIRGKRWCEMCLCWVPSKWKVCEDCCTPTLKEPPK